MGKRSTGSYDFTCRRGVHGIRWREANGKRTEVSLRTTDIVEATRIAPQVFAQHVSGQDGKDSGSIFISSPSTKLDELIAEWIDAVKPELGKKTDETYTYYAKHWLKHMRLLGDVRTMNIGNYQRWRLTVVLKGTVKLELSALRRFFKWLKEREHIRALPDFPELSEKATGTRYHQRRRSKPTHVFSSEQMDAIVESMDEWSQRKVNGKRFPIKARFVVARETGLRPTTIDGLLGKDLVLSGLHIRPENDKNRWERVVPLTPRARAALESVLPDDPEALIFGVHCWDRIFEAAVLKMHGPAMADRMTPYDLKHGRVTELFDQGAPETGVQFLTGTTSALRVYVHPTRSAAEAALGTVSGGRAGDKASGGHGEQPKTRRSRIKTNIS